MAPVYPSLEGGGTLSLKDIKVKGYKLFNIISRQAAKDSLNDPAMRKVTIKSTIKNNIITIERFRFKVLGFRPRIEGQTSFDGQLNLKMRLGLPPLGIIGIPIKVTGTQEEPIVKLGRRTEVLKETEYQDEN
jgi:AsmA protein